jgi:hypothetical protein
MQFQPGDFIPPYAIIGEPPNTEVYRRVSVPVGDYVDVVKADGSDPKVHTVYVGRWFVWTDAQDLGRA